MTGLEKKEHVEWGFRKCVMVNEIQCLSPSTLEYVQESQL